MEAAGLFALLTAIVHAIAAHLKNLSQDSIVADLRREVWGLRTKVEECEKHRNRLQDDFDERNW